MPRSSPVIGTARLRKGNAVSGHGAHRLIGDAVATARAAGVTGQVMVRADSGYYRRDVIAAAIAGRAWFSVTVRMNPAVTRAIGAIPEKAWTTINYPRALWDQQEHQWISEAQVAETDFRRLHLRTQETADHLPTRRPPRPTAQPRGSSRPGRDVHHLAHTTGLSPTPP